MVNKKLEAKNIGGNMRKQKMTECVLTVLIISFVLIGCGSARFATTLKIDRGSKDF
jgi:hypothetical protein